MQTYSGLDYIKIDIANNFGKDKLSWDDRILWFEMNKPYLKFNTSTADNKFLAIKGLFAYQDAIEGNPTGFIMGLDATASGLQIMACLSGCEKTALAVNLIDPNHRKDVYEFVTLEMNRHLPSNERVTRSDIKKNVMTRYYNKRHPEGLTELQTEAFNRALANAFPGPESVMAVLNSCWDANALKHEWVLPDGHVASVLVEEPATTRIEIDELDGMSVTYQYMSNQPSKRSTSLVPNIIHSIDAYVARQMVIKAKEQGFELVHIHDSFWASPNYMNQVRQNYKDILANIADMDLLQDIYRQVSGDLRAIIKKDSTDLNKYIKDSNYALS